MKPKYVPLTTYGGFTQQSADLNGRHLMNPSIYEPTMGSTTVETASFPAMGDHIHRRISWSAILGGVVIALALQLLLSLLGAGIGLGTVHTNAGTTPDASSFGIGAGIWWFITSCIAFGVGGYVAAWLAGVEVKFDGMLHGLITWSIATMVTLYLLSSAVGGIIGGGLSAAGGVASAAGSGVTSAAQPLAQAAGVTPDALQQQAQAYMQPTTTSDPASMSPQDAQKAIASNLTTYARGGGDADAAKERIINIMAAQMKVGHDEAAKRFNDAQAKVTEARDKAVQTAKDAADASASAASRASFGAFGVLLLSAIAAALAGSQAAQRRLSLTRRTVSNPRA